VRSVRPSASLLLTVQTLEAARGRGFLAQTDTLVALAHDLLSPLLA
jgi:hypothetical protein